MPDKTIYLYLSPTVEISTEQQVLLGTLAEIEGNPYYKDKISKIPVKMDFDNRDGKKVLSSLFFIKLIHMYYPELNIQITGSSDTVIKKAERSLFPFHYFKLLYLPLVCILLFVGSGMAIINFHADVSMPTVHQQIFKLLTGEENPNPLILQIPYSLGIGLGMTLFFNHFLKKRFNREPSPLEMEIFLYEENINKYVRAKEKNKNHYIDKNKNNGKA